MAKTPKETIKVPITIAPSGSACTTIALHHAIESFSYEERNLANEWQREREKLDEQPTGPDSPAVKPDDEKAFDNFFDANTDRIVRRAESFWSFLAPDGD